MTDDELRAEIYAAFLRALGVAQREAVAGHLLAVFIIRGDAVVPAEVVAKLSDAEQSAVVCCLKARGLAVYRGRGYPGHNGHGHGMIVTRREQQTTRSKSNMNDKNTLLSALSILAADDEGHRPNGYEDGIKALVMSTMVAACDGRHSTTEIVPARVAPIEGGLKEGIEALGLNYESQLNPDDMSKMTITVSWGDAQC